MQATTKVRRELRLLHPVDGERTYIVGENCDAIEKNGNGYNVHKGAALIHIGEHRVDHYFQDPRPGYGQEQRDAAESALPSYAEQLDDGAFYCKACGTEKKTLHALKTHYGIAHGGER